MSKFFCVNCEYYKFKPGVRMVHPDLHMCQREEKTNLVTGEILIDKKYCNEERETLARGYCGPYAKYFKEKQ